MKIFASQNTKKVSVKTNNAAKSLKHWAHDTVSSRHFILKLVFFSFFKSLHFLTRF